MTESLIQCPNPIILLQSLENIAKKTKNDKEPHLAFFKFGSRNILFKLEGLYRIYRSIEDENFFEQLLDKTKEVEDQMGQYDFHLWIYTELYANKDIPADVISHFKNNVVNAENSLQKFLEESEWINATAKHYNADIRKLKEINWPTVDVFIKNLTAFLVKQISKITKDFDDGKYDLNEFEDGIHELRRKIRWISIYASSVEGFVQLKPAKNNNTSFQKYLTQEVINSPYNQLPTKPKGIEAIYIKSIHFYALSWMIEELGKLKDEALFKFSIETELNNKIDISSENKIITLASLGINTNYKAAITEKAKEICDDFFKKDLILQHMISDLENSIID